MRVLHLDSGREMRGGQWQALRLHRGLIARGHESVLLSPAGSPLLAEANGNSCDVLRPLRLGLLSRQFDLVHAHDARSHTLAALFARVPLVVSRRVAFPVKQNFWSRQKYKKATLYLAVSGFVAAQLRAAGIEASRIQVVHDGVPIPDEPTSGETILVPSTTDLQKAMHLAEAAAIHAGVTLVRTNDLSRDLPQAKALVYLTYAEGLGSGIMLAMAHGVTVIASRVGGIPELIGDGIDGLLTENNVDSVASAFARIAPNIGAAARLKARSAFSEKRMIDATLAAYQRVRR